MSWYPRYIAPNWGKIVFNNADPQQDKGNIRGLANKY